MNQPARDIETPSGKYAAYENFPVGSWLLPAHLRPHIARFYAFARTIDDIADSPELEPEVKIERLEGFETAINGSNRDNPEFQTGHLMRESLIATGVTERHCLDLVSAFKQDAVKLRYDSWLDLIDYCRRSAAPVGRYLLDLHGGADDGYVSSDALCNALQVLNHLQDARADYLDLDRVYLPTDWIEHEGASIKDLDQNRIGSELRRVYDRALASTDELLIHAASLPGSLKSTRLAMEAGAILNIAQTLSSKLWSNDPLASRIELNKPQYLRCCIAGVTKALIGRCRPKARNRTVAR